MSEGCLQGLLSPVALGSRIVGEGPGEGEGEKSSLNGANGSWLESDDDWVRCLVSEVFGTPTGRGGREIQVIKQLEWRTAT